MTDGRASPQRIRLALVLLLPLLVSTVVLAWTITLRGALGVDSRHYFEMAAGFRAHGLPYTLNGYSEYFPEARPRFNIPRDGKLWGQYPPLFPALASLALRVAGASGLVKENFLLFGVLAVTVFFLGWRYTRDPLQGVAASYLTLLATPLWAASLQTPAQPTMLVFSVLGTHAALFAHDRTDAQRPWPARVAAWVSGLCFGLAVDSHLLAFPMAMMLLVGVTWIDARQIRVVPARESLLRGLCAALGLGLALAPVSWINHLRFDTYNPLSYGPCPWSSCRDYGGVDAFAASGLLRYGAISVLFLLVVTVALLGLRKRRLWIGITLLTALAVSYLLRNHGLPIWAMVRTVYGYFVDTSPIPFDNITYDSQFGHRWGASVVKSVFQCSPILACGLLAPLGFRGQNARALLVCMPLVGLIGGMALLSRYTGAWAFGFPHVLLRYAMPAIPLLAVLAVGALAPLPWRRWHLAPFAVVTLGVVLYFYVTAFDFDLLRRVVLLRVSLLLALACLVCIALGRARRQRAAHAACVLACAALGFSIATSQAVDNFALATQMRYADRMYARLAALTPQRFALAAYGANSDPFLSIRAAREVSYIDLGEGNGWDNFRTLIDLWADDGTPVYAIFPAEETGLFRWPYADWDVRAETLDKEFGIWKIEPPEPGRRLTPEQIGALRARLHEAWLERGKRAP